MSLQLDARQRAMLGEMGVRVFEPLGPPRPAEPEPVRPAVARMAPQAPAPLRPAIPASVAQPQRPDPVAGDIERMGWDELQAAVVACNACAQCPGQGARVFGTGDLQPDWLIVGDPPDEAEERQGEPFAGEPGLLLNNMLKALGLDRRSKVYLTSIMKCRLPGNRNPTREEVAQCEPVLRRQVQLLKPRIILVMGRFAVPSLLATSEPIGKLRGRAHQYQGVPVIATYHPAYLLRNLPDKAKAWADLCLAQELLRSQSG